MNDEINDKIRLFRLYSNLPTNIVSEVRMFLTVENIYGIKESTENKIQLDNYINRINCMSIDELTDHLSDDFWELCVVFNGIIKQFKVYISLRPNIVESYPEYYF